MKKIPKYDIIIYIHPAKFVYKIIHIKGVFVMHEHNNYNTFQTSFPLPNEKKFSDNEPVIKFYNLMGKIDLSAYLKSSSPKDYRGRKRLKRRNILLAILFAFSINVRSVREICTLFKYDTRFIFLLNGVEVSSHNTICNIINEIKDVDKLLADINRGIFEIISIDRETIYIDGTKIEAYANKYTFVWKNAVLKNKNKLLNKIKEIIPPINIFFEEHKIPIIQIKDNYSYSELTPILESIGKILSTKVGELVHGKGKRKSIIQKLFEIFEEYTSKMGEYEKHLIIIGDNRNSYSKTDHDATFMRMKEDYMRNGQLKPAYNLQVGISNGYVMGLRLYQDRTDFNTFIPFLNHIRDVYGKYPIYPVADAGYGNYENYKFCEKNKLELYLKYTTYSYEKTRRHTKNIYHKDNFKKDENNNILCPQGYKFEYLRDKKEYKFEGAEISKVYICKHCQNCQVRKNCTKSSIGRTIIINEEYEKLKKIAKENLDSDLGIKLRVNRSIQVEGFFAILKEDSKYKKLYRRTIKKAELEMTLIAIGQNIRRYCEWDTIQYNIKN